MADLIAQGEVPEDSWQFSLPTAPVTLGRSADHCTWPVPWDGLVSRLHATLTWKNDYLLVRREESGRNPIFFKGSEIAKGSEFHACVGDNFVIGKTTFTLVDYESRTTGEFVIGEPEEYSCNPDELRRLLYTDANQRMEALAELPGMIRYSPSDEEFQKQVVHVLLKGIPRAESAAVVWMAQDISWEEADIKTYYAARRGEIPVTVLPSRKLVWNAIHRRRQAVKYKWKTDESSGDSGFKTIVVGKWAICVPVPDEPFPGWGLYVTGALLEDDELNNTPWEELQRGDMKFTAMVAEIFGALRQICDLKQRQATLSRFLSLPVLNTLASQTDVKQALRPRETDITVLFCDLRGFTRMVEGGEDNLTAMWEKISKALNIMTTNIIERDGVIGDFQGDAAMGFWGWPISTDDQIERAARAALAIRRDFERVAHHEEDSSLHGVSCGIGIAHGRAIAGCLGTDDQFKISVFGSVVNLAARLESMTKKLGVPILIDRATAAVVAQDDDNHLWGRCRRLAQVQPYGMTRSLMINELLPSAAERGALPDQDLRDYEIAVEDFLAGNWRDARDFLRRLHDDGPSRFLLHFMDKHGNRPPEKWDQVIVLDSK